MDEEEIVVYVHGDDKMDCPSWYRIVIGTNSPSLFKGKKRQKPDTVVNDFDIYGDDRERVNTHAPVAVLPVHDDDDVGYDVSWTVIGDDIYWAGGIGCKEHTLSKYLFRHNIHHQDLAYWEKVVSLTIPRESPFITAVGGGRKIAIVGGYRRMNDDHDDDDHNNPWRKCGEIYDLDKQTLDYLISEIKILEPYYDYQAQATTTDDQEPKQILFYSLMDGSMLFLDPSTGEVLKRLCELDHSFPLTSPAEHHLFFWPANDSTSVFLNNTLYILTSEMRLYGYDLGLHKWFYSGYLHRKLKLLDIPLLRSHLLIRLPNGHLLVLVSQVIGKFTMASLSVRKMDDTSLDVTVEHMQFFYPSYHGFYPSSAKAISLKSTGSSSTQG